VLTDHEKAPSSVK